MLVYVHIPKTAGTTLRRVLEDYAGPSGMFAAYPGSGGTAHRSIAEWAKLTPTERSGIRVVAGHYSYPAFDAILRGSCVDFLTFLRHPVDRMISLYKHTMAHDPRYQTAPVSLLKFLMEPPYAMTQLDNHQTRMIAGVSPTSQVTEESVTIAIRNLQDKFFFVGLTEYFSEDVTRLGELIGFSNPRLGTLNISSDRRDKSYFSRIEISEVTARSKFDIRLYDHVAANRLRLCKVL